MSEQALHKIIDSLYVLVRSFEELGMDRPTTLTVTQHTYDMLKTYLCGSCACVGIRYRDNLPEFSIIGVKLEVA